MFYCFVKIVFIIKQGILRAQLYEILLLLQIELEKPNL